MGHCWHLDARSHCRRVLTWAYFTMMDHALCDVGVTSYVQVVLEYKKRRFYVITIRSPGQAFGLCYSLGIQGARSPASMVSLSKEQRVV